MSQQTGFEKTDLEDLNHDHHYDGKGIEEDPFVVEFQKGDPTNPMNWTQLRKWIITTIVTLSVFVVTFASSAYSGSSIEIMKDFDVGTEVFIVGVSLFVLGFAIGPALWGPLVGHIMLHLTYNIHLDIFLRDLANSYPVSSSGTLTTCL